MKIPFKSKLSRFKKIESRNEAFKKLSKKQQRQEIAYDALMLVVQGIMKPSYGFYWGDKLDRIKANSAKHFQQILNNNLPVCDVCERGLIMVSSIRLGNGVTSDDFCRCNGNKETQRYFSYIQMRRMEDEYEHNEYRHPYCDHSKEKLANIACNVIANGRFRADVKTDYITKWGIKFK